MKTIDELNADLDMAIEDGDTLAMEEITDQINALLEGRLPDTDSLKTDVEDPATAGDSGASSGAKGEGDGDTVAAGAGDDEIQGVASKDGKGVIPYSVLADARQEAATLKAQIQELQQQQQVDPAIVAEVEKLRRLTAAYEKQITSNNLEPVRLPEELKFTEEQLAQLSEYGDLGDFAAQLARQVEWMKGQMASNQRQIDNAPAEPQQADADVVQADPDLRRWARSDYAWNKLTAIDDYVQTLPQFAGKSLAERKAEVVRLTKIELGEASKDTPPAPASKGKTADDIVAGVKAHPSSLSEMGGASGRQEASFAEQTAGKSEIEIAMLMEQRLSRGESIDDLL